MAIIIIYILGSVVSWGMVGALIYNLDRQFHRTLGMDGFVHSCLLGFGAFPFLTSVLASWIGVFALITMHLVFYLTNKPKKHHFLKFYWKTMPSGAEKDQIFIP